MMNTGQYLAIEHMAFSLWQAEEMKEIIAWSKQLQQRISKQRRIMLI